MQLITLLDPAIAVLDPLIFELARRDLRPFAVTEGDDVNMSPLWPKLLEDGTTIKSAEGPLMAFVSGSTVKVTSEEVVDVATAAHNDDDDDDDDDGGDVGDGDDG